MILAIWRGEKPAGLLFAGFLAVAVLAPTLVFWAVFGLLFSLERTALPWLAFLLAPAAVLFVLLPLAVVLGVGAFRAADRLERTRLPLRVAVVSSLVWAPFAAYVFFSAVLMSLQRY